MTMNRTRTIAAALVLAASFNLGGCAIATGLMSNAANALGSAMRDASQPAPATETKN